MRLRLNKSLMEMGVLPMTKTFLRVCLLGGILLSPHLARGAGVEILESSVLRLKVSSNPYSFRVYEKSSGELLVSQSCTAFEFGDELYPVTQAADIAKSSDSLTATLSLQLAGRDPLPAGTPIKAQVSFRFLRPEVLQVLVSYEHSAPSEVSEEFDDHGEHYYGIWEYPFGGNIDNRGADRDFLGLRNQR